MLIENAEPEYWRDLQAGVARILSEIGLAVEVEKVVETPRGKVELDVYAVDEQSVDKIRYVAECKNWGSAIPQHVVHSFTTVMHEVGANIGFIISKHGLQAGAEAYTRNTNITGMTFQQFQQRYFRVWYERCFVTKIGDEVDALSQYVEPMNSRRDRKFDALPMENQEAYIHLWNRYRDFGITMAFFEFPRYSKQFAMEAPDDLEKVKGAIQSALGDARILKASYMRELLEELLSIVREVTSEFHAVFGENIFA